MILLVLTGCFVRYEPIRTAAKAERQDAPHAESAWASVLDHELLVGEWRQARRRMCGLRSERVAAEVAQLDPQTVTPDTVGALRESLLGCPRSGSLLAELTMLEQESAVRQLSALHAENLHAYHSLLRARTLVPHVLADHPFRTTLQDWRTAWTDQLEATRARYDSPATQAFLSAIERDAGKSVATDFEVVVEEQLANHVGRFTVEADASCAPFAPESFSAHGDGTAVQATVFLRNCATADTRGQVQVPYQVTKYRKEEQQVPVTHTVTTATTVNNVNCYYSIQAGRTLCSYVGTYTDYDKETTTTYVTRLVDVPYQETHYRTEDRFTKTASASVQLSVTTPHGARTLESRSIRKSVTGVSPPSAQETFGPLIEPASQALRVDALAAGRALHLDHLEPRADLQTPAGIEARLVVHGAGRTLTAAERTALANTFALPVEALAHDRPALGDFTPRDPTSDPLAYHLPRVDDGLVRYGFSPLMYTIGFGQTDGGAFEAHNTPRSWGLHLNLEFNGSLSTGRAANGFAVHGMPVVDLHTGWRSNKAHSFTEVPLGRPDNDKEPRMAFGVRGGVGALAGYRNTRFGVFAGVLPQTHFALTGFYKNGGAAVALAARLELRPVPRRPMIVNAWAGNLLDFDNRDYGVRFSVPVGDHFWLTAERSRNTGRTQLLGLTDQDRLNGGPRAFSRTWVGYTYGF